MISEYGAAIWADPYRWIPEAARLLRPGGELVFLGNSTLLMLCVPDEEGPPATDRLLRPQRGMHRFTWPDDPTVEFHLGHGDWIRLLRANRLRRRGPDRALAAGRRRLRRHLRHRRMGRALALRGGIAGPTALRAGTAWEAALLAVRENGTSRALDNARPTGRDRIASGRDAP